MSSWTYFIDRSLPKNSLLIALKTLQCHVVHHDELFKPDASDVEWLHHVGMQKNWIVLSHDRNIGRNSIEINQLRQSNIRAFMPSAKGSLSGKEISEIIVKAIPTIERFSELYNPPFIAKIYRDGSIKKWR